MEMLKGHLLKPVTKYLSVDGAISRMIFGVIFLIICARPALSQNMNTDLKSLHITADSLVANQNNQNVIFSGHVIALYDAKRITSDKLQVFYDDQAQNVNINNINNSSVKKIIATGNVEIEFDDKTATCDQALYVASSNSMILTGKEVRLQSNANYVTGNKITIYQDSGRIIVDGSGKERVNAVFQPEEKNAMTDPK